MVRWRQFKPRAAYWDACWFSVLDYHGSVETWALQILKKSLILLMNNESGEDARKATEGNAG